jgi:hypothetical protein
VSLTKEYAQWANQQAVVPLAREAFAWRHCCGRYSRLLVVPILSATGTKPFLEELFG